MFGNQNRNSSAANIMSMFNPAGAMGGSVPAQQQQQQPQNPADNGFQNANGGQPGAVAGSGQQQQPASGQQQQGQQSQQQSPLDGFSELFKIDPKAANPLDAFDSPVFSLDAAKLKENVSKMDFAGGIDPQLVQRAMSNDPQAFQQVMNAVAQNVFQQAAMFTQRGMESGFGTYHQRMSGALPEHFKRFAAEQELAKALPNSGHAAVNPMLRALQEQFMRANPNLPPQVAAQKVKEYMQTLAQQFAPAPDTTQQQGPRNPFTGGPMSGPQAGQQAGEDWENFFM